MPRAVAPWTWRRMLRDHGPGDAGFLLVMLVLATWTAPMTNREVLERRRQNADQQRRAILEALSRQELEQRVRALARDGNGEHGIAELLRLHVEQVRRILSDR